MTAPTDEDHGPGLRLAQGDIGAVSVCACGVITLTLQYLSLRFEPDAFRSLQQLLLQAQTRLDRHAGLEPASSDFAAGESEAGAPALPPRLVH